MPIDDQNHAALTSQSLRVASYDWSVAIFAKSLESQESYLTNMPLDLSPPQRLLRKPGEREIKRVEPGGEKY